MDFIATQIDRTQEERDRFLRACPCKTLTTADWPSATGFSGYFCRKASIVADASAGLSSDSSRMEADSHQTGSLGCFPSSFVM